ncbi:hypothetical protein M2323_000925 [Rhodoblastus acidophilus]|uniref:hypothetical protein n=1 Tax=Rhodoblastus acidophilus TaxID=1074 RepID=UPI0022242B77|nr:hypothetical protein [Rhodoblastus acidophilus]MCW2283155.1 hypothetical protein [Rhodoblastus acidophilus]MCW2332016.1 hypothetical protein [Rhodoblastus acidophilus]
MQFKKFKQNVGVKSVISAIGLGAKLEAATSYGDFRHKSTDFNGGDWEVFVKRIDEYSSYCSSGEGVLLGALLYRLGYSNLADKVDNGLTWRNMSSVSGEFREAVVACIDPDWSK